MATLQSDSLYGVGQGNSTSSDVLDALLFQLISVPKAFGLPLGVEMDALAVWSTSLSYFGPTAPLRP
eukprot:scaffold88735_cov28-Tisochrysis_lutea.AAC.10